MTTACDIVRWRASAWRYITQKGWSGADREDLVQEMVVVVLENSGHAAHHATAYIRALDRCNPRHHTVRGRVRQSGTELLHESWWHEQRLAPETLEQGLVLHGYLQHLSRNAWPWLIRWLYEGWRLGELAEEAGITAAAMTQRVSKIRAQLCQAGITGGAHVS